jgi:hypothetical protein
MIDSDTDVVTVPLNSTFDRALANIDDPDPIDLDRLAASIDALKLSFASQPQTRSAYVRCAEPRASASTSVAMRWSLGCDIRQAILAAESQGSSTLERLSAGAH